MSRAEIPGSASVRSQVGILPEDPAIFRPIMLEEALAAARIIGRDSQIQDEIRCILDVGIVLDLMPGHLTPRKAALSEALTLSVRTIRRREIAWELGDQRSRFDLVHRASRLVFANRGASI